MSRIFVSTKIRRPIPVTKMLLVRLLDTNKVIVSTSHVPNFEPNNIDTWCAARQWNSRQRTKFMKFNASNPSDWSCPSKISWYQNFKIPVPRNQRPTKNAPTNPTLRTSLSSSNKFSGHHGFNQSFLQCFNSKLTKPYRNPSGGSKVMTQNVSPCRRFSFRPKFGDRPPWQKYSLYDYSTQTR